MRNFAYPGRSPVYGTRAMCATSHPLASVAAIEQLKKGGNAVDAAIAATAVLCVVEHAMTGIGGDCFAIIAKPGTNPVALNASGRAPMAATPEWYAKQGIKSIPTQIRARRHRAWRDRRLGDAAQGLWHALARRCAGAGHRVRRGRLRRLAARRPRLGQAHREAEMACRRAPASAARRPRAEGRRDRALSRTRQDAARDRHQGSRRLLHRRHRRRHGRGAARTRRSPHHGGLRRPEGDLRRADLGQIPRRRSLRDAAEQPGHRRAGHAAHPRAARHARHRSAVGRALSRHDGGEPARLCHARRVRRRPG